MAQWDINNYLEINIQKEGTKLLTGKHELEFKLSKSWSIFKNLNIFKFSCCSCNQPVSETSELIMYGEDKDNIDKASEINNEDSKNKMAKKLNYYSKFKDYDSYNDYIIKIDNIIDNSEFKSANEEKENDGSNNQIKDKEESFNNS